MYMSNALNQRYKTLGWCNSIFLETNKVQSHSNFLWKPGQNVSFHLSQDGWKIKCPSLYLNVSSAYLSRQKRSCKYEAICHNACVNSVFLFWEHEHAQSHTSPSNLCSVIQRASRLSNHNALNEFIFRLKKYLIYIVCLNSCKSWKKSWESSDLKRREHKSEGWCFFPAK